MKRCGVPSIALLVQKLGKCRHSIEKERSRVPYEKTEAGSALDTNSCLHLAKGPRRAGSVYCTPRLGLSLKKAKGAQELALRYAFLIKPFRVAFLPPSPVRFPFVPKAIAPTLVALYPLDLAPYGSLAFL